MKKNINAISSTEPEKKEILNLRKAVNELQLLNEIAITAGRTTDLDKVLEIIVSKTRKEINTEQCSIILLSNDVSNPFLTLVRQDEQSKLRKKFDVYDQIIGLSVKEGKTINIRNLSRDKRFDSSSDEKKLIKNVLCSPIWYKASTLGVFILTNKKSDEKFDEEDQRLLAIISSQAGQLIKNTQLQKESLQKRELEHQLKLTEMEKEKLKELDEIKQKFFEDISHEFRTPLTLIQGPVEQLFKTNVGEDEKAKLNLIKQNTDRLLNLMNQMIELSKIETKSVELKTEYVDLVKLVKNQVSSFQPFAESKKIELKYTTDSNYLVLVLDEDKIIKSISNLLSNAVKYTNCNGKINVALDIYSEKGEQFVKISVQDNGPGITSEEKEKIFNRFYQSKNFSFQKTHGFGIGLSLAKELVELHKGKILVDSKIGEGSTFTIILPAKDLKNNTYYQKFGDKTNSFKLKSKSINKELEKKLLLIDDNQEVRDYIKSLFENDFEVSEADNGIKALEFINEQIPDIIISDQVMPECDGLELCFKVKNDEKTSHIPFILLTARVEEDFKIKAYKSGVDEFIFKPFNPDELLSRTFNLIKSRNLLKEHYCEKFILEPTNITIVNKDEAFLAKAIGVIEKHIEEPDFTVEEFGEELFMSRTQLYRKIHALTGKSIRDLITSIRLKRATKLIESGYGSIAEIAYKVGFNEAAYFTKRFHEEIGCAPSEYLQNFKK